MPKYVTSLTDADDQRAEQDDGALVDFSEFGGPEFSEITAPVKALKSDGTLRQWFFTAPDSPYVKKMGGPVFGARAPNVRPVEPEQNYAEVFPEIDPEVARRRALRQGAVAQKARRNLMGATSVAADEQMGRAGILPTTEEGQRSLATALKAQKDATLPSPERGFWQNLGTAIGGRANEGLVRDIETARDADVSPGGLARGAKAALGTFGQDKSGTAGERIASSIANATPMGALVEATKAFAGETIPKAAAAYRWAETLGTPRIGELANAAADYAIERSREETGERRQAENKKLAEEIARQRRETPAGEEMPYKLPEFQAETARSAAGMEKTGRLVEHIYQGAKTIAGGLGNAAETLLTPTNVVLMNAPKAIVRGATGAAGKDGAISAVTGLGERSIVQRLREGAARAGAESNAALNEANTLREAATEAALKNAGAATPEQATGLIARTRAALRGEGDGILTAPLEDNLWWTQPGRTATAKRIKAEVLKATANALSSERAMHTGIGAYFGYEMAKNLPESLTTFGDAVDRSYQTGDWGHVQGAMPALTEAAMLFALGAGQFSQAKGAHFRTKKGLERYRAEQAQREAIKQYDLGNATVQHDFVREAFTGKDVRALRDEKGDVIPDHWAVRTDAKAPVATVVRFTREGGAQFDPATGQSMEQAAWFEPPAKGVPPTINLRVGAADQAHGVHEITHLLTETGQLSGSLRDIERELGLEYGSVQDTAGIVKLRDELAGKVATATPEGKATLQKQIARLDEAAKGVERLPELVERTMGSSSTFIDSMNRLAEIRAERPDILDVFERAKKSGDREALSQIYADPELRQIYTDTMILGSPEAVAQARKNQVYQTLRFLITGKKSAADVARDIREGRFSLGDAKPPVPGWKPSEIAAGEKGKELPAPEMPVDAIGRVKQARAAADTAKAELAKLKETPGATPEQRIAAAEKIDAAERDFRAAQTSGIAALKEAEKEDAVWRRQQDEKIAAQDLTTEAGRERKAILMEESLRKEEEIAALRDVMKGAKEPPPPPPPVRLAETPPPMPGPVTPLTETVKRIVDASVTGRSPDFSDIARSAAFEPGFPIRDRAARRAKAEMKYGGILAGLESGDPGAEVARKAQEQRPAQIKAGIARGIAEAARAQARRAEMVRDIPPGIYGDRAPESFASKMQPPIPGGTERAGGPAELGKSPARFSMRTALKHLDRDMGWDDQWLALAHPRISTEGVITTGAAAAERLGVRHGVPVDGLNPTTKTKWVQTGKEKNTGTLVVAHEDGTPALIYSLENGRVLGAWNPKLETIDETKPPVEKQGEDAVASVWKLTDPDSPQRRAHAALAEVGVKRNLPFGTFTYHGRRNLDLFTPDQESMRLFRSWARRPKDLVGKIFYQEGDSRAKTPLTLAQIKKGFNDLFNPDQGKRSAFTPESFAIHMAEMDRVRHQYYMDMKGGSALRYAGEDFTPPLEVRHGGVDPGSPEDVGGATGSDRPGAAPAGPGLGGRVLRAEGTGDVAPGLGDQPGSPGVGGGDAGTRFSARGTSSEEFGKFFGKSRVVDEGGKPLEVYHGTTLRKLNILDPRRAVETDGAVFFASNPGVADTFTTPREYGEPVFEDASGRPIKPGTVLKTYLRIENPAELSGDAAQSFIDDSALQGRVVREAKAAGRDGVIARDVLEGIGDRQRGDVFVVFDKNQVKSVRNTGAWGQRPPTKGEASRLRMTEEEAARQQARGDIRFSSRGAASEDKAPVFYSKLRREVEAGQNRMNSKDVLGYLKSKGVKPEEIEWSKLDDLLKSKPVVTKQEILDHLDTNAVKVEEVVLGEPYGVEWKDEGGRLKLREKKKGTLFGIVETLPDGRAEANIGGGKKDAFDSLDEAKSFVEEVYAERRDNKSPTRFGDYTLPGGAEYRELLFKLPGNKYKGGHYEEGTFAHARFNERTGPNSERILHIEEIQSDQHQKAREARVDEIERIAEEQGIAEDEAAKLVPEDFGYTKPVQFPSYEGWLSENVLPEAQSDPAFRRVYEGDRARAQEKADRDRIPNAPFKRTWSELVLKRLFRWAADNGYDRVTWTTGEQQADRYDLAKQIDRVEYDVANHELLAYGHNGREVLREEAEPTVNSLAKHIGKDPAARLVEKIREQDSSSSRDDWSIVRSDEGAWFEVFDPNGEPYYDLKGDILKFWSRQAAERAIDSMLDQDRATTPKPFISGLDLKIGGEGMSGFYDKMLPNKVADIARKLDPSMKVGTTTIDVDGTPTEVHSIDLTPKGREVAKQGFPLFSSRPAPVLSPSAQQTLKEINLRFGIPTPRKETDLGWMTEFTRTFADAKEEFNKLERVIDWRSHPAYKDEYSSPFLAAQDMGVAGTTELAIFGVRATRGKAALPSGVVVDVGPMVLDRSGPKPVYKFHTHKNSAGQTVYTAPLAATLHRVGNLRMDAFRGYIAALHARDVAKTAAPEHGLGDEAKHQALIDEIERNPATSDFRDLAEDFTAFHHWMLDYAVSKRAMSQELADHLKEKYPHFMPMERLFEQETGAGNVGSGGASTGTPVKTRKGSDRKVVDPVWQTIARTHRWVSQVDKNAVGAAITEMMDGILGDKTTAGKLAGILEYDQRKARDPLAGGMSEEAAIVMRNAVKAGVNLTPDQAEAMAAIATPRHDFDKSTRAFEVVVDGKVRRIQADESVIRFMKAVNATPAPMPKWAQALLSVVTVPTSILKWVVTSLPAFQASQLLRDPATATLQTTSPKAGLANRLLLQPVKGRVMPLLEIARDTGRTVGNAIGKTPSIDEALFQAAYQRGPGMFSNLSAHDLDSQSRMFDRLQQEIKHGKGWGDFLYYKGHPLQFLELLKAPFESATRKAEMRRYRKVGLGDVAGTIAGKDISVDFSKFGAAPFMHEANRIFPFLNAGIQSTRKFFQTMRGYDPISGKYDPKRAAEVWARAAIWQTLPTIILWSLNKGDDEIENLRKGDTGLYYNFLRLPKEAGGKAGRIVAMPKAFTWSTVFSTIPEAMLDAIHEANPEALKGTIDGVRAAFGWEPYQPDAKAEVDRRPLGRVIKGIGKEISAGSMPPAVNIYSGIKNNVDPFYNRKIEMEHQRGMEAPQRQGYRTGAMSKDLSQVQFDALRAASQNPLAKALDIDPSKSALGPDQIAFVVSQLGLRDPYNLADRMYSKEVKDKPMPEGPYPAWQDLALGRRRFLPAEPRSTGFSSETFEAIAAEAKTIVDTEKEIGKKDRKSLAGYRKGRDIAWAEQVMTFKEKIDNLQRQKAEISQNTRMDPAERQRKLDMMTNQIRAFERRGILIANKREKAAEK